MKAEGLLDVGGLKVAFTVLGRIYCVKAEGRCLMDYFLVMSLATSANLERSAS